MADTLKLDVIVDDHGAVQTLAAVDSGVNKVKASAAQTGLTTAQLNDQFAATRARLDALANPLQATGLGLGQMAILSGVAIGALTFVAATLRQAAADADRFTAASQALEAPVTRIQQITAAAAESGVGFDQMVSGLARLQARIGAGGIDDDLEHLGINLKQFRDSDVVEQFLQIADAVSKIEDPADRAAARVKLLGANSEEMARLMKQNFREAADDVTAMSDRTIDKLDGVTAAWEKHYTRVKNMALNFALNGGMTAIDDELRNPGKLPTPGSPRGPGLAPVRPPSGLDVKIMDQDIQASIAMNQLRVAGEEANFAMDEYLRKIGRVSTFVPDFMALYDAQKLIAAEGDHWADVLDTRVAASVDAITAKLAQAMQINMMLMGDASGRRDALMGELTGGANPGESDFDKKFNDIDRRHKEQMAAVDQSDRATAAMAENAILEATNLEVMKLQQNWETATSKTADHLKAIEQVGAAYQSAFNPKGGVALPGGLVMPTADQVAGGRYFGPVTPDGKPDPSRMGGAAPVQNITVNAQGAFIDTPANIDRLAKMVMDAAMQNGTLQQKF